MNPDTYAVTEVIPGVLHRVTCRIPLDGRISWAAPVEDAEDAVGLYVLRAADGVLIVDTGLPRHRESLLGALRGLIGDARVSIIVTRMEPDTIGNLFFLLAELDVDELLAVPPAPNPFDFENAFPMPHPLRADAVELLRRTPREGRDEVRGIVLDLIPAPLRVLATTWLYVEEHGLLFTSDSFGHLKVPVGQERPVRTTPLTAVDTAEMELHLGSKYGWLDEADAATMIGQVRAVVDARRVEIIAPINGMTLSGGEVVRSYLDGMASLFPQPAVNG